MEKSTSRVVADNCLDCRKISNKNDEEKGVQEKKHSSNSGRRSSSKRKSKSSSTKTPKPDTSSIKNDNRNVSDVMTEFLSDWSEAFNAVLVQIQVEQAILIAPRKSLANVGLGKSSLSNVSLAVCLSAIPVFLTLCSSCE